MRQPKNSECHRCRFQERREPCLRLCEKAYGRLFSVGNIGSDSKRDTETVGKLSAFFNILLWDNIDHRKTQILTVLFTLFCKFDDGVKRFFTECRSTQLTVFSLLYSLRLIEILSVFSHNSLAVGFLLSRSERPFVLRRTFKPSFS